MSRTRSQAGSFAKLVGDLHEGWCEQQLDKAVHLGIVAHYYHNQPTAKRIGGKWVLTAPGVSDYTGVLDCDEHARTLAIEAKSVEGTRFYRANVTKEQQDHLDAVSLAGGLALLALCFRNDSGFARYVVPWSLVPWRKLRSSESVEADMPELRQWSAQSECFLMRWHPGGKRSGTWLPAGQRRVYATE